MSMDPSDYEAEAAYEQLYDEISTRALDEFRAERLQSYYLRFPEAAKPALDALEDARKLLVASPTAAAVMASVASEVALKTILIRPIVFGLVHSEALAGLVTDMAIQHTGVDRFRGLLLAIMRDFGGIDLDTYTRPGATKRLWQEITDNQTSRNAAVHRAERIGKDTAQVAVDVAAVVLEVVFPKVVESLGLHLHDGYRVCKKIHLGEPWNSMLDAAMSRLGV